MQEKIDYNLGANIQAFTTTHAVDARRTKPEPLARLAQLSPNRIIIPHQTHHTQILLINQDFFNLSYARRIARLEGVDALLTTLSNTLLCISTADCIPVIIYDPITHSAGVVHAGWRGTSGRIVYHTIRHMVQAFGTNPSNLRAVIGPGITLQSFEIGDEVYEQFQQQGFDMPAIARRFPSQAVPSKFKWHIDLPLCNRLQLIESGLSPDGIFTSGICTYKDTNFYSARREGIQTGRNMTCVKLLPL